MTTHNLLNQWLVQFVPTMNFGVKEDPQFVYVFGEGVWFKVYNGNKRKRNEFTYPPLPYYLINMLHISMNVKVCNKYTK